MVFDLGVVHFCALDAHEMRTTLCNRLAFANLPLRATIYCSSYAVFMMSVVLNYFCLEIKNNNIENVVLLITLHQNVPNPLDKKTQNLQLIGKII